MEDFFLLFRALTKFTWFLRILIMVHYQSSEGQEDWENREKKG
jgi:hypothetical protein